MLKFVRKQLEINNYVGPASPGADILDTLLESGNEKVLDFYQIAVAISHARGKHQRSYLYFMVNPNCCLELLRVNLTGILTNYILPYRPCLIHSH